MAEKGGVDFPACYLAAHWARVRRFLLEDDSFRLDPWRTQHKQAVSLHAQGVAWAKECGAFLDETEKKAGRKDSPTPLRSAIASVHELLLSIQHAHGKVGAPAKPEEGEIPRWVRGHQADPNMLMMLRPPPRRTRGAPGGRASCKPAFRRAMQKAGVSSREHREEFIGILGG